LWFSDARRSAIRSLFDPENNHKEHPMNAPITLPVTSTTDRLHQRFFNALYSRSLLYNTCWEDPAIDRLALRLSPDDTLMMITSAGCNALDYAILGPKRIHAVDANPRQTALLELKQAGIRRLDFDDFFSLFGAGNHPAIGDLYRQHLRQDLSSFSRQYWDARLHWFSGRGWRNSFYFHGLSGLVAQLVRQLMVFRPRLRHAIKELLEVTDLESQQHIYDTRIEPKLWGKAMNWVISRRSTMSLLGVPYPQAHAVENSHDGGIAGFIRSCIRAVMRDLPMWTNYFWAVYLRGHYTRDCCPEYLKEDNFRALKAGLVDRITPHTCTVTAYLTSIDEKISRFVLLDHMDWMAHYHPAALNAEWQALVARAAPQARILFRSASDEPTFLDQVRLMDNIGAPNIRLTDRLQFDRPLAEALHQRDRVHTYASFHIADLVH
jgi:S-adenosylmethionine-diacylglycerol 3-amino-3-carboxypropyl transferase